MHLSGSRRADPRLRRRLNEPERRNLRRRDRLQLSPNTQTSSSRVPRDDGPWPDWPAHQLPKQIIADTRQQDCRNLLQSIWTKPSVSDRDAALRWDDIARLPDIIYHR